MFILRNILFPLQQEFNHRCKGDERGVWFVYTLLAVITHFTSSRSANLLRCLQVLFGLSLSQRRFYIFMASSKLPWSRLWTPPWSLRQKDGYCWPWMTPSIPRLAKRFSAARLSLIMLPRPINRNTPGHKMLCPSVY